MKIRLAKKILHSKMYRKKWRKLKPDYFDEKRNQWVSPTWSDIPLVIKAKRRYYKWVNKYNEK